MTESYYKVRQALQSAKGITYFDRKFLKNMPDIEKCDKKLLRSVPGSERCDNYYKVRINNPP